LTWYRSLQPNGHSILMIMIEMIDMIANQFLCLSYVSEVKILIKDTDLPK